MKHAYQSFHNVRGDQLERFEDGFGSGEFRPHLNHGSVYTNVHYQHANSKTIVGHITLANGALPSLHGMIGNAWFDHDNGTLGYYIEDPDFPLIPTDHTPRDREPVDPSLKAASSDGRSPASILAPTLSDTLAGYYAGQSKIFAMSGKDHGRVEACQLKPAVFDFHSRYIPGRKQLDTCLVGRPVFLSRGARMSCPPYPVSIIRPNKRPR